MEQEKEDFFAALEKLRDKNGICHWREPQRHSKRVQLHGT